MDRSRLLVHASVAVILGVSVVSGPAVGLLDLTTPRIDGATLGQGNATVDGVEAPDTVRLDRNFQSKSYALTVPDARIRVATIEGHPLVAYTLEIPEIGYSRTTTHFLGPADSGWVTLSIDEDTFPPAEVGASQYRGNLTIVLRGTETERVIVDRSVAVEVTE